MSQHEQLLWGPALGTAATAASGGAHDGSPDLSGADICNHVFRDHPEGSQRTRGLPENLQKGQESLAPTSSLKASQEAPVERSS